MAPSVLYNVLSVRAKALVEKRIFNFYDFFFFFLCVLVESFMDFYIRFLHATTYIWKGRREFLGWIQKIEIAVNLCSSLTVFVGKNIEIGALGVMSRVCNFKF